ncbi:ECs1072 family phage-associated protein, partial [Citrobacter portucalensis]|uniref:ECs1072 family phage-associated protein n=1 Tax=Citrobacter portucalensis TaxID=1639133 RepID=UPI003357AB8D
KRAYCLKIQPATGSFARNLIYSTKPNSVLNLDGGAALHHLVFQKTNWTPETIRSMGYFDLLWVLLDDLVPDKLSETAQSYLQVISKNQRLLKTDLMSYAGWQIGTGDQYLKDE